MMMEGNFDLKKTPLEPPGTRVIGNENPNIRHTWGYNGVQGWYIGPGVDHYLFYKVYIYNTRAESI